MQCMFFSLFAIATSVSFFFCVCLYHAHYTLSHRYLVYLFYLFKILTKNTIYNLQSLRHTSGNMWLTRCDYVQRLIDPYLFEKRMDNITSNCTSNGRESCDGRIRYSAEHWIHSHPTVKVSFLELRPFFKILGTNC
ncbi:MAG: hypothetical protein ACI8RD_004990 [Bacillariaceae sp.]|jgi:hypothetical protein